MEKELQQKLEEIAFRLQRLTDDYHEILKELSQMDEVKKSNKVLHEQYIAYYEMKEGNFYHISSNVGNTNFELINICKSHYVCSGNGKYRFINKTLVELTPLTTKVIETYIPSKNLVLVVEL